jgi:hypothetical protein
MINYRVGKYDLIDLKITNAEEYESTYKVILKNCL